MSDTASKSVSAGFPIASILTIIFVIAKLTGYFAYSWWIVFLPIIIPAGVVLALLGVLLLLGILAALVG